jgi:hypothetical protein
MKEFNVTGLCITDTKIDLINNMRDGFKGQALLTPI